MARQESPSESSNATSVPTPISSPMYQVLDHCSSSTGSESNIISCTNEKSLRNQLLRRMWNKGYLELDRSHSYSSPTIRRSQKHRLTPGTPPDICKECTRIEQQQTINSSPKCVKLIKSASKRNIINTSQQQSHSAASSKSWISQTESDIQPSPSPANHVVLPEKIYSVTESEDHPNANTLLELNENKLDLVDDTDVTVETSQCNDCLNNNNTNDNKLTECLIQKDENKNIVSTSDSLLSKFTTANNGDNIKTEEDETASNLTESENKLNNNFSDEQFVSKLLIDQLNKSLLNIIEMKEQTIINNSSADKSNFETSQSISVNCIPTTGDTENTEPLHQASSPNHDTLPTERKIYFPIYSVDEKDDQSTCCTPQSTNLIANNVCDEIIPVHTGSCYPNQNYTQPIVVSRSIYRTESTEVQPSTASTHNNDTTTAAEDSDESLVDSLDDPVSPSHHHHSLEKLTPIKQAESFFVPITENSLSTDEMNVPISMPEKIRKKLIKRHQILDNKKLNDNVKKQNKLEKAINRSRSMDDETGSVSLSLSATKEKSSKSPKSVFTANAGKTVLSSIKSAGNKFFRSEIGLLETYTIDAKGNMQFQEPKKLSGPPIAKRKEINKSMTSAIKKQQSTNVIKMKRTKTKKSYSAKESSQPQQLQQQQSHSQQKQRCREVIKDVKQVTLYQAADIITPDNDCGPKRMYQKTEISDGDKRIEILEIVECIDSSSCSDGSSSHSHNRDHDPSLSGSYTQYHRKSKIPIPITSSNHQKSMTTIRQSNSSGTSGSSSGCGASNCSGSGKKKMFIRNMHQISSNTKVDEMIADLLIDALNNPKDNTAIDYMRSPKQLTSTGSKSFKRGSISSRRMTMQDRSRHHSANNSAPKYHQIFEVIPEEKSGLSVDSSNEDVNTMAISQTRQSDTNICTTTNESLKKQQHVNEISESSSSITGKEMDFKLAAKEYRANGKAAVQDEYAEPKAWVGFFKQHDESSVDSGNEGKRKYFIFICINQHISFRNSFFFLCVSVTSANQRAQK